MSELGNIQDAIDLRRSQAVERKIGEKLKLVALVFGQPMRDHYGGSVNEDGFSYETFESPDWGFNDLPDPESMPYFEDGNTKILGWHFDSLSSGVNFQVLYTEDQQSISATFEGYLVYREVSGTINCYIPSDKWEKNLDSLYSMTLKSDKLKQRDRAAEEERRRSQQHKQKYLSEYMRKFWGLLWS